MEPAPRSLTQEQTALVKMWRDGVTAQDIAERLGTTRGLIYSRIRNLRESGVELETRTRQ
jgi:DNA-binding CsgD family transcriptional regulator